MQATLTAGTPMGSMPTHMERMVTRMVTIHKPSLPFPPPIPPPPPPPLLTWMFLGGSANALNSTLASMLQALLNF